MAEAPFDLRVIAAGSTSIPAANGHGNAATGLLLNGSEGAFIVGKLTGGSISLSTPCYLLFNTLLPSAFFFNILAEGETPDVIGLSLKYVASANCLLRWERVGAAAGTISVDWQVIGVV